MAMVKTMQDPNQPKPAPGQSSVYSNGVSYVGNTSTAPYRSNLQTNFQGLYTNGPGNFNSFANDSDADVRQGQELQNQLSRAVTGNDPGADQRALAAQLDAVRGRIGQKNAFGEAIGSNSTQEGAAENDLRYNAGQAMSSGVRNTRRNYNNRGLLYSGLREGGENAVRSNVAGNLAEGLASTKRDYSNLKEQQKQAYAAVDMANQQHQLDLANQAFDTVTKNNVARAQAYQQLGGGIGAVVGTIAGGRNSTPNTLPAKTAGAQIGGDVGGGISPSIELGSSNYTPGLDSPSDFRGDKI